MKEQELLTAARAAEMLGYTPQHVTRLARQGALRGEKFSGSRTAAMRQIGNAPPPANSSTLVGCGIGLGAQPIPGLG
ncbi:MAG: helix-turn-helix domain-containing protein [Acidobacteria bacterium]|nr:helix-turn-helix domain-containing protein [Acidobacteriota bacterium]